MMNKQEAIEVLQDMSKDSFKNDYTEMVHIDDIVETINKIDETQKAVVPKFVAEWLKKYRYAHTLLKVLSAAEKEQIVPSAVNDWILDNQYDFIKAWHDGYTVEQEKLYTVEIPNPNSYCNYTFLSRNGKGVCIDSNNHISWKCKRKNHFTEAEIKKDFEWAWQWAVEVEETENDTEV